MAQHQDAEMNELDRSRNVPRGHSQANHNWVSDNLVNYNDLTLRRDATQLARDQLGIDD